jgi:hypothetical protein
MKRPGHELIERGVRDLEEGRRTWEALLVAIGAPRLESLGLRLPGARPEKPELALYHLIAAENPRGAHAEYNALVRRLVSYEQALGAIKAR